MSADYDVDFGLDALDSYYDARQHEEYKFNEYMEMASVDKSAYANPWERIIKAAGKPEIIDTSKDARLRNIFENRKIALYPAFTDFFGLEQPLMDIMSFMHSAAAGAEEAKQILYFLGPVGSAKSSLAKRFTQLMEQEPIFVLKYKDEISPVFDNPLSFYDMRHHAKQLERMNIDPRYAQSILSPWTVQKLKEGAKPKDFTVVKTWPSIAQQIAITRVEPKDPSNQDVSDYIGKIDMTKLEIFAQSDPRAYAYSGGLCRGNRGIVEPVEMFKSPISTLNPLLSATQDRQYNGTETIGALPFEGIILAHSNETEWAKFRNEKTNEAFIDRVRTIKVPYTLRLSEELKIYQKYIRESGLRDKPCAPQTLEILSRFSVLSRLMKPVDSALSVVSKMKVYDGQNIKTEDPKAKTIKEYRDEAYNKNAREGMSGSSVRFAFKTLSETYNLHAAAGGDVAATPIDLIHTLQLLILDQDLPEATRKEYLSIIDTHIKPDYKKYVDREIRSALLESYEDYGQTIFERYFRYAELSLEDEQETIDPYSHTRINKAGIEKELSAIEKPAGITNPVGFRNELVRWVQKSMLQNGAQQMPRWNAYNKFKDAIESKILDKTSDLLPIISFGPKQNEDDEKKQRGYAERMMQKGYTEPMVRQLTKWYEDNRPT